MIGACTGKIHCVVKIYLGEVDDVGGQCGSNVAVRRVGVVLEADLKGDQTCCNRGLLCVYPSFMQYVTARTFSAKADGLDEFARGPVPKVELVAILGRHQRRVKPL